MLYSTYMLSNFVNDLKSWKNNGITGSEDKVIDETVEYIQNKLLPKLNAAKASWKDFLCFWPPRYVKASRSDDAMVFFGAGLSLSCGVPSWNKLLTENFHLDKELIEDKDLQNDPLTLAELVSQDLGSEILQKLLHDNMNQDRDFSINHAALAALRFPIYITTNYDCLFEKAWKKVNGSFALISVTNDADMLKPDYSNAAINQSSILFKIHGSADRDDERLILTRRDYRYHYRTNDSLFTEIRRLLREKQTLFLGFSHKDPEISRLVEDVIYDFEKSQKLQSAPGSRPHIYSLQFEMNAHTPEVFAARGIVALTPPVISTSSGNLKTQSLAIALTDLIGAKEKNLHEQVSLDHALRKAIDDIYGEIKKNSEIISNYHKSAESTIAEITLKGSANTDWLSNLCSELGEFASQGVYLLNDQGEIVHFEVPIGLDKNFRKPKKPFNDRPYFKQAKFFRKPFVSDTVDSYYQGQSTFFLCVPVLKQGQMSGLLFSASQVGQWKTPIDVAERFWQYGQSFLLIDSNGVCLLPPKNEFPTKDKPINASEVSGKNIGYPYDELLELSRRDMLVRHISKCVVPISQDDEILNLGIDFKEFVIVSEIQDSRWKIAVSVPVRNK